MSHIKVAPYFLRHAHHLHHLGDGVHADDVRAGENGGRHGRSCSPITIRRGPAVDGISQKRLARRAHQHGTVERRRELRESCQHTITVRRPFGKPDARIDDDAFADPDWLFFMVQSLLQQNASAVGGPKIVNPSTSLNCARAYAVRSTSYAWIVAMPIPLR